MAAPTRQIGALRLLPTKKLGQTIGLHLLCLIFAIMFMIPFFWTVSSSLKHVTELYLFPPLWFPETIQWHNYIEAWTRVPFLRWTLNSAVVTTTTVLGSVLSASLVAYSFARFRYPFRNAIFIATLATLMLPPEVTIIPLYLLFNELRWLDSLKPLIIPYWFGGGAFNIFLMRQFIMTIPRDLDEAALIDGANPFQIFWRIILPLSKPALATMAVIGAVARWSEFLEPLVFLNTTSKFTLALGLRYFQTVRYMGGEPMDHLLMAASVTMALPIIVLFFLTQRFFVRGIVMSGIKG